MSCQKSRFGMSTNPSALSQTTCDGFLDNSFHVIQPRKGGHRSGLDAVLLAATVPADATGRLADFGSGCGVAGMAVAQRCPHVDVELIEKDAFAASLAKESLLLEQNAHLTGRVSIMTADLLAGGSVRNDQGLAAASYDHIICNPPYNDEAHHQRSPSSARAAAHVASSDMMEKWIKTASAVAKFKAQFTLILRPESLGSILELLSGRFGGIRILPVLPNEQTPASLMLLRCIRGGRAALQIMPPLCLHPLDASASGAFTPRAEEILRGRTTLDL